MQRILISLLTLSSIFAHAEVTRYDQQKTRSLFLERIQNPPLQQVVIVGETTDVRKRALAEYFRDVVNPKLQEIQKVFAAFAGYTNLVNMAAFTSEAEKILWIKKTTEADTEMNRWKVDSEWTAILAKFAELAEGLTGTLPEDARRMYRDRKVAEMPPEAKPLLDEITKLNEEWGVAKREAPANREVGPADSALQEITVDFKNGKMSFLEAKAKIDEVNGRAGPHFVGYQAMQKLPNHLNRIAVLRTKIAHMKGYKTWAEYALKVGDVGYTDRYQGATNQREFLESYLKALGPLVNAFLAARVTALGADGIELNETHDRIVNLPSLPMLNAHFPKDKITSLWEETLLESGFKPETLRQVFVDDGERANKDIHVAYQWTVEEPSEAIRRIDVESLNPILEPKGSPAIRGGLAVIMQTWKTGGLMELKTAFHEGGHSLEGILKNQNRRADVSYGTVEIPSMTSERFVLDPLVLFHKALAVNGERPTLERVKELVANFKMNHSLQLRFMAMNALYDLNLWDYDYTQEGARPFLERIVTQWQEISHMAGVKPAVSGAVPKVYDVLVYPHFISGDVQDIGYTFAEIASRMATNYLTDEIEKLSGRRTWWRQPLLGKLFTEQVFEKLWQYPFPTNIEKITGQKFNPSEVIAEVARELGLGCEAQMQVLTPQESAPKI